MLVKISSDVCYWDKAIHLIVGGFHLVAASDEAISKIVATLKDTSRWRTSRLVIALASRRLRH
jgi:metal-dependent hydrolase (beta-lactamase superfamily II)